MNKNFHIDQTIGVQTGSHYFDLHNDYDFCGYSYLPESKLATLSWVKKHREWVSEKNPDLVQILFLNVQFVHASDEFQSNECPSRTIEDIGYLPKDDQHVESLIWEDQAKTEYHIVFRFDGDEYIRIYADSAVVNLIHKLLLPDAAS